LVSQGLQKERLSYSTGEAFSPSKRTLRSSKNEIYKLFSLFLWVVFALLDPDPDCESGFTSRGPTESGSTTVKKTKRHLISMKNGGIWRNEAHPNSQSFWSSFAR
jgi:hypothetical protein